MPDTSHSPSVGTSDSFPEFIAHYRVLSRLGKGGMGEVFLAEDTKQHGRRVALKVLPEEHSAKENRLRRFRKEARAILALNHPNILTVFEIGEAADGYYIATEYIEGETLRQSLWRERPSLDETLGIAIQISMALEAAHAEGIVHRDIKPENVMLRDDRFVRDRFVKVLDFGLAKLMEPESASDPEAVTIPITQTNPGSIIGTTGYMSPEQAEGEEIDERSDIFSLGVVLYEMVAGDQPFKGRTDSHTRVSILDHEPTPLLHYDPQTPRQLERIVAKALAKDRTKRYQTITDLKLDLEQLRDELYSSRTTRVDELSEVRGQRTIETHAESAATTLTREQVNTVSEQPNIRHSVDQKSKSRSVYLFAGALVLAVVAVVLYSAWPRQPINSVAVLPFVNDSKDPDTEYLSDGITESIINSLSQLP
ncbi:MAG TPA: serine/threonine-protein kinase, partial [Pyrinomonadaceae bacterium]|nr:serine/threonine-protein kinase [Pyrinomonadaceae bacterium]